MHDRKTVGNAKHPQGGRSQSIGKVIAVIEKRIRLIAGGFVFTFEATELGGLCCEFVEIFGQFGFDL